MKSKKRLYLMIALVSVLLMWSFCGTNQSQDGGGLTYLHDRPWVAKMTKDPREMNHALIFLSEAPVGAAINGSIYQHVVTLLEHKAKGNKLTIEILQANKRFTTLAKTYACKGPKGLDLCLDLGPRMKKLKLYSSSRWKIGEAGTPDFGVKALPAHTSATDATDVDETTGLELLNL